MKTPPSLSLSKDIIENLHTGGVSKACGAVSADRRRGESLTFTIQKL